MLHRLRGWLGVLMTGVLLMSVEASVQAADVDLKVGDAAPKFEVQDDSGKAWSSADHFGKKIVVVYFYPADMTGGCTKQACGFRDDMKTLTEMGVEVVGVSGDSVRNHQLFKKEYNLDFALLADVDGHVADKFGVPYTKGDKEVKAQIDGKEEILKRSVTIKRWTFVIDKSGKIVQKSTEVKPAEDSKAIIELVKSLK